MSTLWRFLCTCVLPLLGQVAAFVELPKFNQLQLLYPGYHGYSEHTDNNLFRNHDIADLVGGNHTNPLHNLHNTSPLRMSVALNRYGGRHAIGTEPITLEDEGIVSVLGNDHQQYIFQNTAFGPFLAAKYGEPLLGKPNKHDATLTMQPFVGKQGIVRFVSYHTDHAGGHIGLWNCDGFFQSPDWSTEHHLISVEFWETPDSYCAPKEDSSFSLYKLLQNFRLVPRDSTPSSDEVSNQHTPQGENPQNSLSPYIDGTTDHKVRHGHKVKEHRLKLKDILLRH